MFFHKTEDQISSEVQFKERRELLREHLFFVGNFCRKEGIGKRTIYMLDFFKTKSFEFNQWFFPLTSIMNESYTQKKDLIESNIMISLNNFL